MFMVQFHTGDGHWQDYQDYASSQEAKRIAQYLIKHGNKARVTCPQPGRDTLTGEPMTRFEREQNSLI